MIVFSCLKKEFIEYIEKGNISNKVYDAYKEKMGKKTRFSMIKSWANSLPFLKDVIEVMPDNMGITIEYNINLTSKSVDVILSGYDIYFKPVLILIELKQWDYVNLVANMDAMVKTKIGGKEKITTHPAYQVLSYMNLLKNYNIYVDKMSANIIPIVYLHNYLLTSEDNLYNKKFKPYYNHVLMFGKNDLDEIRYVVENNIIFGDNLEVINMIDMSLVKPTKKLVNVINNMINDKKEFTLLDEQKVILESISKSMTESFLNNDKVVIIVKGGPGTGKSVLALNLLGEFLKKGFIGSYVSKNMAPREVYKSFLTMFNVNELFKSSGSFFKDKANKYDFLIVDEAHRLQEKSGIHGNIGENQIKEIINSAKMSVFFVDDKQAITLKDIGSVKNIEMFANKMEAKVFYYELLSQFRCNGSNNYLDFIEGILYNKRNKGLVNFDFKVIDSPLELHKLIISKNTNNNARLVAGFCWKRDGKNADNQDYHDIVIDDFSMSWNLKHGEAFAIRENAINEIGCVYNVQGLEFDYIGVIIGLDLKYRNGKVVTDYKERASTEKSLYGLYKKIKEDKDYYEMLADNIIRNTYRVLLTRGIKGCYVFAQDKDLQNYLKKVSNNLFIV